MSEPDAETRVTRGYSLPRRMHGEIASTAKRMEMSKSALVGVAVRLYIDRLNQELDQPQQKAS